MESGAPTSPHPAGTADTHTPTNANRFVAKLFHSRKRISASHKRPLPATATGGAIAGAFCARDFFGGPRTYLPRSPRTPVRSQPPVFLDKTSKIRETMFFQTGKIRESESRILNPGEGGGGAGKLGVDVRSVLLVTVRPGDKVCMLELDMGMRFPREQRQPPLRVSDCPLSATSPVLICPAALYWADGTRLGGDVGSSGSQPVESATTPCQQHADMSSSCLAG